MIEKLFLFFFIFFQGGTFKRVGLIFENNAKHYKKMGSGKMNDLFGAIWMGIRHYKGDFLREVVAYHPITDPEDEVFDGYRFYKERADDDPYFEDEEEGGENAG